MSTLRYSSRKRTRFSGSCDDSSDSEVEVVPAKHRRINGDYGYNVPIFQKLKQFLNWMLDLPVKDFFTSAVRMGSPPDVICLDDDEDDDDDGFKTSNSHRLQSNSGPQFVKKSNQLGPISSRSKFQDTFMAVQSSSFNGSFKYDDSQEFVHSNGHNPFQNVKSFSDSSVRNNESSSSFSDFSRYRAAINSQKLNSHSNMKLKEKAASTPHIKQSPVDFTSDIEILFDSRNANDASEMDEIEIMSEISSSKSTPAFRLQCKKDMRSYSGKHPFNLTASSSSSKTNKSKLQAFTVHEVVRLHEKDQYKLLLEKYVSGPLYQPTIKKSSIDAVFQTNSSPMDLNKSTGFTKETLHQPIDKFLEKYLKPCQLLESTSITENHKTIAKNETKEIIDVDNDNGNEPFFLPMKLPQLRPLPKSESKFFSNEWISELKLSVNAETEERLKIVEEQERQLNAYNKERELLFAAEKKKRDQLRIKGIVLPETGFEEADFFELTPEMEEVINNTLSITDYAKVLSSKDGVTILKKDLDTLSGLNWLNDEIINYYLALIVERGKLDNYPSVYSFNSFFYPNLRTKGFSAIKRWTRRVDIFSYDINLVPLHLGVHWCLAIIDHRYKKIQYYDSMGSSEDLCVEILRDYLIEEKRDKKSEVLDPSSYSLEIMKDIPQQMNGSDCGMFTLKYAEYITRDAEITFTQKNMQNFRRRMVYEILKNQLL